MSPSDIFRVLKIAYPFLEAFKVEYDEDYDAFDLVLEMSEDCPDPTISFVGRKTVEEAIGAAITFALIA